MGGVISLEFLCQLHSEVRAVADQWMHEWTRTVLEFTQLRQMQEFSAITEDFTLTLARGVGRGRCHWSMCNWDECGGADVWNFSAGKFLQEIVRFNLGPSSFNCDAICTSCLVDLQEENKTLLYTPHRVFQTLSKDCQTNGDKYYS